MDLSGPKPILPQVMKRYDLMLCIVYVLCALCIRYVDIRLLSLSTHSYYLDIVDKGKAKED